MIYYIVFRLDTPIFKAVTLYKFLALEKLGYARSTNNDGYGQRKLS